MMCSGSWDGLSDSTLNWLRHWALASLIRVQWFFNWIQLQHTSFVQGHSKKGVSVLLGMFSTDVHILTWIRRTRNICICNSFVFLLVTSCLYKHREIAESGHMTFGMGASSWEEAFTYSAKRYQSESDSDDHADIDETEHVDPLHFTFQLKGYSFPLKRLRH